MVTSIGSDRASLHAIHVPENVDSIIIALSSLHTDRPETWPWLTRLSEGVLPGTAIYSFKYPISPDQSPFWEEFLAQGRDLASSVEEVFEKHGVPIVLMSHSLGGLVVKRALCLISENSNRLHLLYDAIAASVFFGTPHSKERTTGSWHTAHHLFRRRRSFGRRTSINERDARVLGFLCKTFERAVTDLRILSVLEKQDPGTNSRKSLINRTPAVVGRAGIIGTKCENKLYISSDHATLCKLDETGQEFSDVASWLRTSIATVRDKILAQKDIPVDLFEATTSTTTDLASDVHKVRLDRAEPSASDNVLPQSGEAEMTPRFPLPFYYIPYEPNKDFFGREDLLAKLQQHLYPDTHLGPQADHEELSTFAICGPGGMGKTQTAAQFALSSTNKYDAILWMRAETHAKLANDFNKVAVALGLVEEGSLDAKDLAVTRELVKGWLNRPRRCNDHSDRLIDNTASWLLIFDNADVPEVLFDFWPPSGSVGSVLVTSRDIKAKTSVYGVANGHDLRPFSADEGARLMMRLTKREDQPGPASRVAKALRGYPLALTQMSGVMLKDDLSFDQFLALYDPSEGSDGFSQARAATSTYQHTVATVFAFEQLSKMGRRLLIFLSLIDSDISEKDIIQPILGVITTTHFPNTALEYEQAREELTGKSLVMHNRRTGTLSVNILVQDAALFKISSFDIVPVFHFADNRRWEQCEKLSQHGLRLKDRFSRQSDGVRDELALNTQFASLLNEVGWYLQERGQSLYAMDCFRIARDHLEKIIAHDQMYSEDKQQTYPRQLPDLFNNLGDTNTSRTLEHGPDDTSFLLAETYRNLGTSAADICDVKTAYDNYVKYKELMLEQLGDDDRQTDPRLAISYLELAVAHAFKLEYKESKICSEVALFLCESIPLPEMVMNLRTLAVANLALALLALGDAVGARDKALQALQEREQRLGPNDRSSMLTGRLLHALGNIYLDLDETERSLSYHMRAMMHYKETVGPTHHRTADMCFKVAQHKYRTDHLDEAKKYLEDAHKIYQTQKQHYKAERARVLHWKAKLVPAGEDQSAKLIIAADLLKSAQDERGVKGTTSDESDFDEMVVFWSR
ncbi:hypothetical protein CBER1_10953 [Cercospora berteroae]|uniref:DUF7779 domain-containing protein n=1 Tax=Cercospora berteroae TaxID=357750 RepID=A0A2S6BZT8_9PEZI|nr:hypothetical protein CBER1_10953 [Cercospora berteroae]